MKIEQVLSYLPYKIKAKNTNSNEVIELSERIYNLPTALLTNFKLILKPLHMLSDISEDGINEHSINLFIEKKYNIDYGVFSHYKNKLEIQLDGDSDLRYDSNKSINFNVMLDIKEQLLKGNYDIYNLIKNKEAIDINEINN